MNAGAVHAVRSITPGARQALMALGRHPQDLAQHAFVNLQSHSFALRLIGPRGIETVEVGGPIIANDVYLARQLVEQGAGIGPLIFPPGDRRGLGKPSCACCRTTLLKGRSYSSLPHLAKPSRCV